MSGFPSVEVVLLLQSAFDFQTDCFIKFFGKNQVNHNLPCVRCKMQDSEWIL